MAESDSLEGEYSAVWEPLYIILQMGYTISLKPVSPVPVAWICLGMMGELLIHQTVIQWGFLDVCLCLQNKEIEDLKPPSTPLLQGHQAPGTHNDTEGNDMIGQS